MTALSKVSILLLAVSSVASAQLFEWNYTAGSDSASGDFLVSLVSSSEGTSTYAITAISNGTWDGIAITSLVAGSDFTSTGPATSQNTLTSPLEFTAGPNDILYIPGGENVEVNLTNPENPTDIPAGPFNITEAPWNPSDAVILLGGAAFCVQGYRRRRRKGA